MIIDSILGLERYFSMHPGFEKAYRFLRRQPLEQLAEGRHVIDGDNVYATVSEGPGKTPEAAKLEVHDSYIDIQVLVKGIETMGWRDRRHCQILHTAYNEQQDMALYDDEPNVFFTLVPEHIVIFFPYDAHAPMISDDVIRKIIVKVKI
ncbi:MAG: YhcH/YjgK/YiaL family protein [Prevotellaceae bacterium]|jgi:YhcH/YjgK/YiaL family protein|nr:YhcH/YjgK/YiaL family protein [Prevotellaceae bacterium]